ncbi:MAG: O-antigen ligase family protein [Candidatus Saccharicenans sp.]|jgi:O-antigen ligase|nr:O-antigen ligase family protein [Candidatus Saccharicenans sp.]MDH7493560.1 O-antigen ligase family protein [Candidatus Saccharicenans sp.]
MKTLVFISICLLVWLLPLPFGGNIEWAVLGLEVTIWLLFLAYLIDLRSRRWSTAETTGREKSVYRPVIWLVCLFYLVALLQLVPAPASLVRVLSPAAWSWRQSLLGSALFSPDRFKYFTFSLSPWASSYELLKYLSYGAFVLLLVLVLNNRARIKALALVLISAGVFQSLYGLSEFFGGTNRIFTWVNRYYSGSAFGTFVNRDHYSAFLEMVFPLSLGYFLVRSEYFSLRPGLTWRQKIVRFGQEQVQKSLLFVLPPLAIGLGLFFSRCRSGIIIFIVVFFLTLILLSVSSVAGQRKTEKTLVRVVVLLVLLGVVLIGLEPVLERFTQGGFFDRNRLLFYDYTLNLISDYPLLGCGLGTYVQAINPYLQKDFNVILSHAHNDYLEMLAEAGLIGGGALVVAAWLAFGLALKRWLRCQDPLAKGIGLGALMGIFSVLFHSLSDFSLRMPGNALLFLSLLVLAARAPLILEKKEDGT